MNCKDPIGETTQDMATVCQTDPRVPGSLAQEEDIGSLARELAGGHAELVDQFRRYAGMNTVEATEAASTHGDHIRDLIERLSPEQMSWATLSQAVTNDPALSLAAWERIKDAARQEWQSGHRTAKSLEPAATPMERARFLALREAFRAEWEPHDGIETALIDLLAQSFGAYLLWSERLGRCIDTQCETEDAQLKRDGYWMPPRLSEAKWLAWCAEQAEGAHRRFLMTLKSLQDLRRLPAVRIASVGQLNLGTQQVNLAPEARDVAVPE